ncbi:MAG: hypothetical protein EBZ48_13405 [Proteobacteria bacterium]|nr:hypothetical protein [Pseudomonadota bacterium]
MSDNNPVTATAPKVDLSDASAPASFGAIRDAVVLSAPHTVPDFLGNRFAESHLLAVLEGCNRYTDSKGGPGMYAGKPDVPWTSSNFPTDILQPYGREQLPASNKILPLRRAA